MPSSIPPLRWSIFMTYSPSGTPESMWHHEQSRDFDYMNLDDWVSLAKTLEDARFDTLFWADQSAVHETYGSSWEAAVKWAVQFPIGDPLVLAAAMISGTKDLGFAFSSNVIQDHPYSFARKLSTLDHLSKGRIAWNMVTASQPSAWRNFGYDAVELHAERYARLEEYLEVVYKLLEGSWDDDAVVRDLDRHVFAEPSRVRDIDHEGKYFRVPGIHTNEPSTQRVPVLFQAGSSNDGRNFSAKHAELNFIAARNPTGARTLIEDVRKRAQGFGRGPDDVMFMQWAAFVIGSTEEEAQRKFREIDRTESSLVMFSALSGVDLSQVDLDTPIGDLQTEANQGSLRTLVESMPDKSWTFREYSRGLDPFVGTPEQLVRWLRDWQEAGVSGISLAPITGVGEMKGMLEQVVPVLKDNGLIQREYSPGTLREKLFSAVGGGPRLPANHPAAAYRR